MKKPKTHPFGSTIETIIYPSLLLIVMWLVYWAEQLFPINFHEYGVLPKTVEGLKGILFMPLIHSKNEIAHIINNSLPIVIFLGTIVFFYREIALKIFVISWLSTGFLVWIFAENKGAYHIGMSGVIYAFAGFLFTSGVIRKFLPLQAISMFVALMYGSMIWGVFPMQEKISWEGHLSGLLVGVILAFYYKKEGPTAPKYRYEIEKEMGIEPPDLEGIYHENVRLEKEREEHLLHQHSNRHVVYHFIPEVKPLDESDHTKNPTL
jgi:membrane associated rhomboid family serine protease